MTQVKQEQYQVLHVEKRMSIASGLSRHITRETWTVEPETEKRVLTQWVPDNVDEDRIADNHEYISREWEDADGILRTHTIEELVQRRLKEAEVAVRKGQHTCLEFIFSGSHDAMCAMDKQTLDSWGRDTLKWAQDTFGKENVVHATMHCDERSPHMHVVVVPIVTGESKKTQNNKKRKVSKGSYKIDHSKKRLCANEVLTKENLYKWHDSYAFFSNMYNLQRGVRAETGSVKRHENSIDYNRRLKREGEQLQAQANDTQRRINQLELEEKKKQERLQQLRKEERKMDNIKNNFTKKVINKVFGRETEIEKDNNILKETVSIQNEEIKGLKLSLQLTKEALKAEEEDHNELKNKYHEQILETERKENTLKDELSKSNKWLNSLFLVLNDIFKNMPEQKQILSTILRSFIHKDDFQEILKIHKQQVKPEKKQAESQHHKGSGIKR